MQFLDKVSFSCLDNISGRGNSNRNIDSPLDWDHYITIDSRIFVHIPLGIYTGHDSSRSITLAVSHE